MSEPNPRELLEVRLDEDNVEQYKAIDCEFYEDCLDRAAQAAWKQFHCRECQAYRQESDRKAEIYLQQFGSMFQGRFWT